MFRDINPKTEMVVDLRDCSEVKGAVAIDEEAREARVARKTFDGSSETITLSLGNGMRVVRRR